MIKLAGDQLCNLPAGQLPKGKLCLASAEVENTRNWTKVKCTLSLACPKQRILLSRLQLV